MTYPRVAFVDSPSTDAEVRFDFNDMGEWSDEEVWPQHEGFTLGAPTLEGDPDSVGVEYGLRTLQFDLLLYGSKAVAAEKMSALAKELLRQRNWLLFQLSAYSEPVWFRTYRTAPGEITLDRVYTESESDIWGMSVSLDAEPFAYGEQQAIGPVTISNDAAASTNPLSYVLPDILGDAPAPLSLALTPSIALNATTLGIGVAASTEAGAWDTSEAFQVKQYGTSDGGSAGTGSTTVLTGSAMSNGSARTINFSASASTLLNRYSIPITWGAGAFKVLVRGWSSDDTTVFGIKGKVAKEFGTEQVITPGSVATWFDLGEVSVPFGQPTDVPLSETLSTTTASLQFMARQVSGSGTLTIDVVAIVPSELAKGSELRWLAGTFTGATTPSGLNVAYVNSESERVALVSASPLASHSYLDTEVALRGEFPKVWPGRANTLLLFQALFGASNAGDAISRSTSVVGYYYPRHLHLAASA